jgi:hypothetical protein
MFVMSTFFGGLITGPARPCLNHPGHSGMAHHPSSMMGHVAMAAHGSMAQGAAPQLPNDDPGSQPTNPYPTGCNCLGLCHGEQAPFVATSGPVPLESEPAAPQAPVVWRAPEPELEHEYPVPLARPPPLSA